MSQVARVRRWLPRSLGPALMAAGFALGFVALFTGAAGDASGYQRVVLPGDGLVDLSADRGYTLYYEHRSKVGDRRFDTGTVHGLSCALRGPGSAPVPLRPGNSDDGEYTLGPYSGGLAYTFHTGPAGRYSLTYSYAEQADKPIVLAITDRTGVAAMVAGLVGIFAAVGAGIAIAVVQAVRRSRPEPPSRSTASRLVIPALLLTWAAIVLATFTLTR